MDYTKSVGNVVELQCLSKFIEMGFECSIPYGDSSKYDFIADLGKGEFIRIQCKSAVNPSNKKGEKDEDSIMIYCVAQTTNTQKTVRHKYTKDDIDYFATYYNNNVYLIPVEECSTAKTLRFAPPKNGNLNYNKAENYLIEIVLKDKQNERFLLQKLNKEENKKEIKQFYCIQCGENEVYEEGNICVECTHLNARTVARPSREELKDLIRNESFVSLGRKYNVSDNAIKKWCKAENLPSTKTEINRYTDEEWRKI